MGPPQPASSCAVTVSTTRSIGRTGTSGWNGWRKSADLDHDVRSSRPAVSLLRSEGKGCGLTLTTSCLR